LAPSLPHSTHDAAALPCRLKSALRKKSDKKPLIIDVVGVPLDYRLALHACPRSARRTRSHLPSLPPALHAAGECGHRSTHLHTRTFALHFGLDSVESRLGLRSSGSSTL
jgi:hypothetical protein